MWIVDFPCQGLSQKRKHGLITMFLKQKKAFFLFLILALYTSLSFSQTTFGAVYDLLQSKCSGCHGGALPEGGLDLSGTMPAVYSNLVNVTAANIAAAAKGQKLIDSGYPKESFLLRKIAKNDWDTHPAYDLDLAEGSKMPAYPSTPLLLEEIELIRQWIYFGAPDTGWVIDTAMLRSYYHDNGIARAPRPAAPDTADGFQLHIGPIFLAPGTEAEYFKKERLPEAQGTEITGVEFDFLHAHHVILFRNLDSIITKPEGFRIQNHSEDVGSEDIQVLVAAQSPSSLELPDFTGFSWPDSAKGDVNIHLLNSSPDSIIAEDLYLNVSTVPEGTSLNEMKFIIFLPNGFNTVFGTGTIGENLVIPPGWHTVTDSFYIPVAGIPDFNIWYISSHTHGHGMDLDVYERNADGTKGIQIYEGWYNADYSAPTSFYNWSHPPVRIFDDSLYTINMENGIIFEAEFFNPGPDTIFYGPSFQDEMMNVVVNYIPGDILTPNPDPILPTQPLFYPNPTRGTLVTTQKNQAVQVIGMDGRNWEFEAGNDGKIYLNLAPGIYFIENQKIVLLPH